MERLIYMQMIRRVSHAILGMGMAFTILWGVADHMAAFAEVRQVDVTGRYFIGEATENFAEARERAHEDALRMVAEQVSVLVESYSESHNMELTKDEIQAIAAAILSVKDTQYSYDTDSENHITVLCHILATADSDAITEDMLRERNPIRREAQIAEYEKVLKESMANSGRMGKDAVVAWDKLVALDPSNLAALKFAYQMAKEDDAARTKFLSHIENVYASHAHDLEACAYLCQLYGEMDPPQYERALVYANKGIEEVKKRYSQAEIERIVNSTYWEKEKFDVLMSTVDDKIEYNPVYLIYVMKCMATGALVYDSDGYFIRIKSDTTIKGDEVVEGKVCVHYKTDW